MEFNLEYYKQSPDKFVEELYGIKLLPHQRLLLKMGMKNNNYIASPRFSGYADYKFMMWLVHMILFGKGE